MKKIAYVVTDSGIDGREPERILYASFSERERDALLDVDKAKAWRGKKEMIVDIEVAAQQAVSKLNGIDRLVLGLKPWPTRGTDAVMKSALEGIARGQQD